MSGGYFGYQQHQIRQIADDIRLVIELEHGGEPPHDLSDAVLGKFLAAEKALEIAYIYAREIDYLLSGDTVEESFISRINERLEELK
jgi:hypothetical protein